MNMQKKYVSVIVGLATFGVLALAMTASAATVPAAGQHRPMMRGGQMPAVAGTVSAINGDLLTVSGRQGFSKTATAATFTVDATNAKVTKNNVTGSISSIAVGDTITAQGTVSGTTITATNIRDGVMAPGMFAGMGITGKVATIDGTSLTVTGNARPGSTTQITYTVDASSATVMKNGIASSVPNIAVGDMVMVQGTVSGTSVAAKTIRDGLPPKPQPVIQGNGQPVVAGSITTISGSSLTITNKSNVTYTVDATNAKISINNQVSSISSLATGDTVVVQGTVNGNSVVASSVIDQKAPASASGTNAGGTHSKPAMGIFGGITNFFQHLFGF